MSTAIKYPALVSPVPAPTEVSEAPWSLAIARVGSVPVNLQYPVSSGSKDTIKNLRGHFIDLSTKDGVV